MHSTDIWEVESIELGNYLNVKDNHEKREEVVRSAYFVSLWIACHLLSQITVKEEQG